MRLRAYPFILLILLTLLSGCSDQPSSSAPEGCKPQALTTAARDFPTPTPSAGAPKLMEIGGKSIKVDKVVQGALCNDTWSGTVYVGCEIQVYPWEKHPTFLDNCNLNIKPGTVVYVAAHNNTVYYNGCSCHTSNPSAK